MNKALWLYSLWVAFVCAIFFFFYGYTGLTIGWMAFIMLAVYFGMGSKLKDVPALFCSLIAGLIWGQLNYVFNGFIASFGLSMAAVMFIGITIMTALTMGFHLTLLGKTLFNRVPIIFAGVALTFCQGGENEIALSFTLIAGLVLALICSLGESYIFSHFANKSEESDTQKEVSEVN